MAQTVLRLGALAVALQAACAPGGSKDLIFIDGRAVAAAGDTLLALTRQGDPSIIVRDRRTGAGYTRAEHALASPHHIQEQDGRWYVSDSEDGRAVIVVFSSLWEVERRIPVAEFATAPHQFAVLPDGRIVLETTGGRLIALSQDSVSTFALVEESTRTGLLIAALGGVLHAVPDRTVTLYNDRGNIRWRRPWPWGERAFVTDLAVDPQGRLHALAGEQGRDQFYAYSLDRNTGEPIRWSVPSRQATFVVGRLGEIEPDSAGNWIRD